jgi:ribosome-binding protein aMBF1 (putative translation factor)
MKYRYFSEYGKVLPLPEVNPRRRYSSITADLQKNKDPKESNRTRTNMLLAYKIIGAIKNKGWNKSKFAEEMKKKPSVVTRWLSGTHNFTSDTLCDIGFVLGINLFDLENDCETLEQLRSEVETYMNEIREKIKSVFE